MEKSTVEHRRAMIVFRNHGVFISPRMVDMLAKAKKFLVENECILEREIIVRSSDAESLLSYNQFKATAKDRLTLYIGGTSLLVEEWKKYNVEFKTSNPAATGYDYVQRINDFEFPIVENFSARSCLVIKDVNLYAAFGPSNYETEAALDFLMQKRYTNYVKFWMQKNINSPWQGIYKQEIQKTSEI